VADLKQLVFDFAKGGADATTAAAEEAAALGEKGLLSRLFGINSEGLLGKAVGKGAAVGVPAFLALEGGAAAARGIRAATTDATSIRKLLADPKLLERLVNNTIDSGDLDAFIAARDSERLAKLGIQSPKTLDTLRALMSGSDTPRLARGETRIGSGNDTEILDKVLSQARLFGS